MCNNRLITRQEELKNDFNQDLSILNKNLEHIKLDNEKLRFELKNFKTNYDDIETLIHNKEIEFHRIVEHKDTEYNSLLNTLREVQHGMQDLEVNFNSKIAEFVNKIKNFEENEIKLINKLKNNEKILNETENEFKNYKQIFENCQKTLIELNHQIKLKDEIIEKLKSQYNEVLNELNENNLFYKNSENINLKEHNRLIENFTELAYQKDTLAAERHDFIKKNELLFKKNKDLAEILDSKYKRVDNEISKERAGRDITEKTNRDLIKILKENEEKYINDINKMMNYIKNKEKEFDTMKEKFINKIEQNKLKIDEQISIKNSLAHELYTVKDWAFNIEKNLKKYFLIYFLAII